MYGDTTHCRQAGFSLIEILVTMVVLSIGLLGVAGMQASGLRNNHAAYTKTQATNLAMDMAERIRANPKGQDNYDGFDTNNTPGTAQTCISANTGCNPTDLAKHDKFEWSQPIRATNKPILPGGRGIIQKDLNDIDNQGDDEFVVTILWREIAYQDITFNQCAGIAGQEADQACFQMRFKP